MIILFVLARPPGADGCFVLSPCSHGLCVKLGEETRQR